MKILVLEGDGIGPEICAATVACLQDISRTRRLGLEFETAEIGFAGLRAHGSTLSSEVFERARAADGVILGPVSTADYPPVEKGSVNPSAGLRKGLDLYANIRPSRVRPGIPAMAKAMDLVVMRENTEGFYADRNMYKGGGEFMPTEDVALAIRKITRQGCRRIAEAGFELAARRRQHVTAVHKANVLHLSEGLFEEEVQRVAARYPNVAVDDMHIDAACSHLIRTPEHFDVIVTTNMFGDIMSNIAAEMSGSMGLASSLNRGDAHAVAQSAHGSAPDIAGKDLANPAALMLSTAMLLEWLGERHQRRDLTAAGQQMASAVEAALVTPAEQTVDLGGKLGTAAFGRAVAARLQASA
jgi:3-isopropylmalate dehydrogenase